jgi:long-chain acyl-CoA synthetase
MFCHALQRLPTLLKSRIIALDLHHRPGAVQETPDKKRIRMESQHQHPLVNGAAAPRAASGPRYPWLKNYPPNIDWSEKFTGKPLPALLEETAAQFPDRTCTNFLGKELSYARIQKLVDCVAMGLQKRGVKKGVNVGLMLPNTPTFVIFYFAIMKAGGTVVNFNPLYTVEEISVQAKDSQPLMMITLDLKALFPKVEALLASGVVPSAVVCSFAELLPVVKSGLFRLFKSKELVAWKSSAQVSKIVTFKDLIDNDGKPAPVAIDPDQDVAVLQYTGGTTGTPKGAMLTHSNLTINVEQLLRWAPGLVKGEESIMGILPFFHVFGMTVVMNFAIAGGTTMILMPRFELVQALKLIRSLKPTLMPGVPTLYNALLTSPSLQKGTLSSLKFCFSGGAPLPVEVKRSFEAASGCALVEGYGLSETSPVTNANPLEGSTKSGSIGVPIPSTRLSIRSLEDPTKELPLGENGEICLAGPQVMKGYWNRPKETADAMVGEFFRTGDVGYMDAEGYTFIVDRIKDIIICSGFNVYPRRIEEAIYEFPAVAECTVVGVPDSYRGEAPKAYVKLREGMKASEGEIMKFLENKLSKIEMPAEIEFRDELPKTLIGKLSKKELRAEMKQANVRKT